MNLYRLFALGLALTVAGSAFAFEAQCPANIETTQQLVAPAQPGWTEFSRDPWGTAGDPASERVRSKSGFSGIQVYDGPPKGLADLIPDNERDTWTLGDPKGRIRPQFMACVYDGTYVRLVRQLPANVVKCHASEGGKLSCTTVGP